jgi:hypothetical protein
VTESYYYNTDTDPGPACDAKHGIHVPGYSVRFSVRDKGEIQLAVPGTEECLTVTPDGTWRNRMQPFMVTGGTGDYAGVSGTGTVTHDWHYTFSGAAGTDTWVGTVIVPS